MGKRQACHYCGRKFFIVLCGVAPHRVNGSRPWRQASNEAAIILRRHPSPARSAWSEDGFIYMLHRSSLTVLRTKKQFCDTRSSRDKSFSLLSFVSWPVSSWVRRNTLLSPGTSETLFSFLHCHTSARRKTSCCSPSSSVTWRTSRVIRLVMYNALWRHWKTLLLPNTSAWRKSVLPHTNTIRYLVRLRWRSCPFWPDTMWAVSGAPPPPYHSDKRHEVFTSKFVV